MDASNEAQWKEVLATTEEAMKKIEELARATSDVTAKEKLQLLARFADALLTESENIHSGPGSGHSH